MQFTYAKRTEGITGSAIREIFKILRDPAVISFAGGMPAPESFAIEDIADISKQLIEKNGKNILQYGATEGWPAFLDMMPAYAETLGIDMGKKGAEAVLPITGSTQAMNLMFTVYLDPGDKVIVENPTFLSTLQQLKFAEAEVLPAPMDDDGMDMDALEEILKKNKVKLIYTIPNFQNPMGATLALGRRKRMLELAQKYDTIILEDDPYRDLRYVGEHLPTIKSFDEEGRVLYVGSFSKIVSPGLRVAYVIGHPELVRKLTIAKQSADVHTSNFNQAIVAEYVGRGLLPAAIKKANAFHAKRMQKMLDCAKYFPAGSRFIKSEGGFFLWAILPCGIDTIEMFPKSIEQKVAYLPGKHFFVQDAPDNTMRLNYTKCDEETIERGMRVLGDVIKREMER